MGVHQTDVWTMLKPQDEWRPGLTRDELIEEMDKALIRERARRQVRLQPADRDAGQRAGGGRQERRRRARSTAPTSTCSGRSSREIERVLGQDSRRARHQDADLGPPADAPRLGPPRPARALRDQGVRRARRRRRARRHDGRHRSSRGEQNAPTRSRSACPSRWRNDPEKIKLDPGRRPARAGRSRCATWPTSTFEEGPERDRAGKRPAPGRGRRERPRPRHRRVRRRGPGRDRRQGEAPRRATSSAGAASSSTSRRPRSGS